MKKIGTVEAKIKNGKIVYFSITPNLIGKKLFERLEKKCRKMRNFSIGFKKNIKESAEREDEYCREARKNIHP